MRPGQVPRLRPRDVVLLDNLKAHTQPGVPSRDRAVRNPCRYLPAYSHDFKPIESAWTLVKKHIRICGPRQAVALRRRSRSASRRAAPSLRGAGLLVQGYGNSSMFWD